MGAWCARLVCVVSVLFGAAVVAQDAPSPPAPRAAGVRGQESGVSPQRPNIVVVLVDDVGWSDIGCYGGEIPTPNLDALAAGGLRFTQFYNCARCSPTRASLITGLYPHQAGMGWLDGKAEPMSRGFHGRLLPRSVTIGEMLQGAGYFTAMTGKWHMGQQHGCVPWEQGFDRSLNSRYGEVYFPVEADRPGTANLYLNGKEIPKSDPMFGKDWYSTDLFTDWGLKFIDEAKAEKKPFFLYIAQGAAHFPLRAPAATIEKHKERYRAGWDKLRQERYQRQIAMGLIKAEWPLAPRPPESPAWDTREPDRQDRFVQMMAAYAAMIDHIDQSMGKLAQGLKERGLYENTLILFLHDNGGNAEGGPVGVTDGEGPIGGPRSRVLLGMNWATLNNTPFARYKHFTHEGGIATPLIAHWPAGIEAGEGSGGRGQGSGGGAVRRGSPDPAEAADRRSPARAAPGDLRSADVARSGDRATTAAAKPSGGRMVHEPGHVIDIAATAADLAGATYPAQYRGAAILPMEGVSLRPAFNGQSLARKQPIFWEHEGNKAVREGRWKLVQRHKQPWQLYNMEADRTEQHDLIKDQPEVAKKLETAWNSWAERTYVDEWNGPDHTDWGMDIKPPAK